MSHGMGVLGWTPDAFWSATPIELYAAISGWQESHGIDPGVEADEPMSMSELYDMMERFPDVR